MQQCIAPRHTEPRNARLRTSRNPISGAELSTLKPNMDLQFKWLVGRGLPTLLSVIRLAALVGPPPRPEASQAYKLLFSRTNTIQP